MSKRQLGYNALSSIAQVVLSAIILFVLYRLLARKLGAEQIGVWSLVMVSTSFARLADMGLGGSVVKFVAGDLGRSDIKMAVHTISMTLVSMAVGVGTVCVLMYPALQAFLPKLISDAQALGYAQMMMPYSLLSLWIVTIGSVFLSVLDGCFRTDKRAAVTIGASALQLIAAYFFIPQYGLKGLVVIQIVQSAFILICGCILVVQHVRQPLTVWFGWNQHRFRELLRYGSGIQVGIIGQLLYDPIVKALLTKYGGIAMTGYYEMASRMIGQFRAVIVSAFQTLVPFIAGKSPDKAELSSIYLRAYRFLFYLAVPYFAIIGILQPFLMQFLLGHYDKSFLITALISICSSAANTMVAPAYFMYLAVGRLRWTVLTHLTIGICNIILSGLGGYYFGGYGVLVGAGIAYTFGSYLVVMAFHREHQIPTRELFPTESYWLALVSVVGVITTMIITFSYVTVLLPVSALSIVLIFISVYHHKQKNGILQFIR